MMEKTKMYFLKRCVAVTVMVFLSVFFNSLENIDRPRKMYETSWNLHYNVSIWELADKIWGKKIISLWHFNKEICKKLLVNTCRIIFKFSVPIKWQTTAGQCFFFEMHYGVHFYADISSSEDGFQDFLFRAPVWCT